MKTATFRRSHVPAHRTRERGVTMILVALSMVALIAMAALSIDVVTLYLAREEAQRAADAGALAAARVISVSGITGTVGPDNDPASWTAICGGSTSLASVIAQAVAQENGVAGRAANHVTVTYSSGSGSSTADCTAVPGDAQFGVNPLVTVLVTRSGMPTLFSRIWSRSTNTVSATATAEVLNPSNSGNFAPGGDAIPVTPRCVKPLIIPNYDPRNGGTTFISKSTGSITTVGIRISGGGTGIIGEGFSLKMTGAPPAADVSYIPAYVTSPAIAFPACADDSNFQKAIGGCDQSTVYACGTVNGAQWDSSINPGLASGDTATAAQCLIHQNGQDSLDYTSYPYQMKAGPNNPIAPPNQFITSSASIVTLPIYDDTVPLASGTPITILGFLQVFIDNVDTTTGNLNVHVLNIAGCGNAASTTLSAPGTSPVPIRLITPQ